MAVVVVFMAIGAMILIIALGASATGSETCLPLLIILGTAVAIIAGLALSKPPRPEEEIEPFPEEPVHEVVKVETIHETVKVRCRYCGTLNEVTDTNCQSCGGTL